VNIASGAANGFTLREETGLHDTGVGGVVVQRLPGGEPYAFGALEHGEYRIRFPDLATFAFVSGLKDVRVDAPVATPRSLVESLFRTVAIPFALQTAGYEALHASAVQTVDGVIAFCGQSGTGKTTLAYGLSSRSGFRLWADDALVFAPRRSAHESHVCLHLSQELNLRPQSRAFFGVEEGSPPVAVTRSPEDALAGIVLLEPATGGTQAGLTALGLANALTGVLEHAYCFFVDEGRESQTVQAFVDLVAAVPTFRLRLPLGFDRLEATLDVLEARFRATAGAA
jgi:hypothetical protein